MQRSSTKLRNVADGQQLPLLPDTKIASLPVDLARIPRLRSTKQALEYACQLADVVPKDILPHMGCDKTVWSRICSGEFDLDGRDILKFDRAVNNDAYLFFLVHQHGYDLTTLRKYESDKDRRIAELEQKVADQQRAMQLWVEAQKGRS